MAAHHRTQSKEALHLELLQIEAAKKDRRRFGVIYERYYEQIFRFVIKRTADEDLAGDLVSQVFLKAMTHLDKYQFKGVPFSAWLYRIAINEINQYFRQTSKQRVISMDSAQLPLMMEELQERDTTEDIQRMVGALQHLPPEAIEMVELRYFEKLSFRDIGAILGITENNAKVKMYRLLAKIRKLMNQPPKSITPKQPSKDYQ
ncbi:sigma-70 family RNA polymerase sigma factor [Pontibacter sp. G13]|uniref:RNA polymerase sigma factor n=1 Tax=Pontibacter sp. G13 TaxID=3074898 RepID=UPI00288C0980|nr:sigma-70 family RNA polymerase sigma factor [Pontibacter sp. G13]WNJ21380.1 sigma-70 family RNA polymerase sigma factor [Pontibacter sp. G13]